MSATFFPELTSFTIDDGLAGTASQEIIALANGGFVVAWRASGGAQAAPVLFQLLDAEGAPVGDIQRIDPAAGSAFHDFELTTLGTGFAVTCHSSIGTGMVQVFRFEADGAPAGGYTAQVGDQNGYGELDVAELPGQQLAVLFTWWDYVEVWSGFYLSKVAGADVRVFGADGTPTGPTERVASVFDLLARVEVSARLAPFGTGYAAALDIEHGEPSNYEFSQSAWGIALRGDATGWSHVSGFNTESLGTISLSPWNAIIDLPGGGVAAAAIEIHITTHYEVPPPPPGYKALVYVVLDENGDALGRGQIDIPLDSPAAPPQLAALPNGGILIGWQAVEGFKVQYVGPAGEKLGDPVILQPGFEVTGFIAGADGELVLGGVDAEGDIRILRLDAPDILASLLPGDDANNVLQGAAGADLIHGFDGDDDLRGGGGDDSVNGGAGADTIAGGEGHDTVAGGTGNDWLEGGAGTDVISFVDAGGPISVHLGFMTRQATRGGGYDQISGFEAALGSAFNDTLVGGAGHETLSGLDGSDLLIGGGGDDLLQGGAGADRLQAGPGADTLEGGEGLDVVDYAAVSAIRVFLDGSGTNAAAAGGDVLSGIETILGAIGHDMIAGDGAANRLTGATGNDTLWGRAGADQLEGGPGDDRLLGGTGADILVGGAGNDLFVFDLAPAVGGVDRTNDYSAADDQIVIDASAFGGGLVAGGAVQFVAGAAPSAAGFVGGVFLYNTGNGFLSFDADGGGAGAAVAFFRLQNLPVGFGAADFTVVA